MTVAPSPSQLVELRNYQLKPDALDEFVEHFERRFVESQNELGMDILGIFRHLDEPDRFVWVRRYLEPSRRAAALTEFYTGPVWKQYGPRANEMMLDVDDVHLVEPDASLPKFPLASGEGEAEGETTVVAALYELGPSEGDIPAELATAMTASIGGTAPEVRELGRLVTSAWPNDFPALPIHEDVRVGLWLLADGDRGAPSSNLAATVASKTGHAVVVLHLAPTARSTLR